MKITKINIQRENSQGQPLLDKNGKAYYMVHAEFNGDNISRSMYLNAGRDLDKINTIQTWKEGDEVEVMFEDQGQWKNFKLPNKADLKYMELENQVKQQKKWIAEMNLRIMKLEEWS